MHRTALRTLTIALALTLCLPAAIAAVPARPGAPALLLQPIDWVPQNVVLPEELPPLTAPAAEPTGPAVPVLYEGIGTGSALLLGPLVNTITHLCTAAFAFQDPTSGDYYLSTAGHCLVRNANDPTPRSGYVDPSTTTNEVRICVRLCLNNALEFGTYVRLYRGMPGAPAGYDPVMFAQSGGVGTDFGLIRIPASLNSQIRPFMPQFGGPTGTAPVVGSGSLMAHYGHGTYCCPLIGGVASRTPVDQGRVALSDGSDGRAFDFIGWATGGDSGSGMSLAVVNPTRVVQGTLAVGVLTHGIAFAGVGLTGIGSGTLVTRGLQMVQAYLPTHPTVPASLAGLTLVKGNDTICLTDCGEPVLPPRVDILSPANGTTVPAGDLLVSGRVNRAPPAMAAASSSAQAALPLSLPSAPQAASLVHPTGGQTLYLHTTTVPVGNVDRLAGGADLVEEAPTSPISSVSAHPVTLASPEGANGASWTYHGPVALTDADVTVTWYGALGPWAATTESWEAHLFIGAAQIASVNSQHAVATGTFPIGTGPKTLTFSHVEGSGTNLVLMLRSFSAAVPAVVLFGSTSHPSGLRVVENAQPSDPPTAAFSCTTADLAVACDASASTDDVGITSYAWTFGDGATATGVTASHTYASGGNKTIGLTVRDASGNTDRVNHTYTVAITSSDPPVAAFTCTASDLTLSCDASASTDDVGITSYAWTFGDGGTGSGVTTSHTYASGGSKTVGLTVRDGSGQTDTESRAYTVTAPPPPTERVELLVDGVFQRSTPVTSTTPGNHAWNATLDLSSLAAGGHTLTARWVDADGTPFDTDTIGFQIEAENQAPTLTVPDTLTAAEGGSVAFTVTASDPDGDPVTLDASGLPAGATFDPATGSFAWSPNHDQAGNHTVTFTADDGRGGHAEGTVTMRVTNTNRAPALDPIPDATVKVRKTLTFTVQATDPDGDPVSYAASNLPAGATFNAATRTFSWTPSSNQDGSYTVTFKANDGQLADTQDVNITVTKR